MKRFFATCLFVIIAWSWTFADAADRFASQHQFNSEVGGFISVKAPPHNAVGDGIADDTAAIQSALNVFTNGVAGIASGRVYFPQGTYKITSPLIYAGSPGYGIHISGSIGGTRGPTGTIIQWHGAAGGTMMITNGANGMTIENLEFYGRELTRYGLHISATNGSVFNTTLGTVVTPGVREVTPASMSSIAADTLLNIDTGANYEYVYVTAVTASTFTANFTKSHGTTAVIGNGAGSSGTILRRLTVRGQAGAGSAAIVFGNVTSLGTMQVSEVEMYDLGLFGDSSTTEAGIRILTGGNVKNYKIFGGSIAYFKYGVDWPNSSGTFLVNGLIMGGQTVSEFRHGNAHLHIQGVETESTAMFVTGSTGASPGSLTIIGSSYQSTAPAVDDYIISYSGNITLIGNFFYNYRTVATVPKIKVGTPLFSSSQAATIFSQGNFYQNAPAGYAPFYEGSDVSIFDAGANQFKPVNATSLGDYGGEGGTLVHLKNYIAMTRIVSQGASRVSNVGVLNCGTTDNCIAFRNNADSADVVGLSKDSSDVVGVGGSAGVAMPGLTNTGAATGKKIVCVDTATGKLYASSTGTECSN